MAPLRVSITKSEWLPDDLTAFVPLRLWKSPFITTWDGSQNQNHPTDSADQGEKITTVCYPYLSAHLFLDRKGVYAALGGHRAHWQQRKTVRPFRRIYCLH